MSGSMSTWQQRSVFVVLALLVGAVLVGCGSPQTEINTTPKTGVYVALGDSYSAAPGVPSPQANDYGCQRSTNNYPSLVARALHIRSFADRTCGGAQTADMTSSQMAGVAPQLASLSKITKLVTLGIGANDFDISATLTVTCPALRASDPTGSPCADAVKAKNGAEVFSQTMSALTERISRVIKAIHKRAPHARVLVVGYPQSYPSVGTCGVLPVATGDVPFLYDIATGVDDAVRNAARENHATFIDVWGASAGHDLCSAHPWINGATWHNAAPYHPFEVEQKAVATLIKRAIGKHFPPRAASSRA